nr:5'-methylthioadenosine/adenosylhomocysteine nucleosidase [uncultured Blautia sp.]
MKTIGIIGAMEVEIAILKEKMEDVRIIKKASMEFYEGTLAGRKVVVVRSGIGKVNAGICAQILVDVFSVDAIINTGIAGSLNKDINIGDIVLSTDVVQHDMDATGFGYRKGQIPQMPVFFFNADEKLRRLAAEVCKEVNPDIQVFEGRIASGDQFVCAQDVKNGIVAEFSAYATEMEGAAIGQAAYLNEVPFLIIRAISDKADGSAQMDYSEFEKAAVEHSVKLTLSMLEKMN